MVWDRYSEPRYRFSIDDNSFFLRDIAQKEYKSLFDCFYLKMLRDLHTKYGVKFTVNIYYTTPTSRFPTDAISACPSSPTATRASGATMPHWLRLAFHAYANKPDRPYQDAPPEKLIADMDLVAAEIRRFAGEEAYAPPTVHPLGHDAPLGLQAAGEPRRSRAQRRLLVPAAASTTSTTAGTTTSPSTVASTTPGRTSRAASSSPWSISSATTCPWTASPPRWSRWPRTPITAEIMDLFTHEQYFWPFYCHYIPDHPQRLDTAIRWVTEHGYKPVFFHEGFLGGRE